MAQQTAHAPQRQMGLHLHQLPVQDQVPVEGQSHLKPFDHQVAGQSLVFGYDATTICKSLIPRELSFYKTLPAVLEAHVPQFRGVVDIALTTPGDVENETDNTENGQTAGIHHPLSSQRILDKVAKSQTHENVYHFILLENIVANFQRPCILDLKMGTRQHGDDAPPPKVQYQMTKCRTTTSSTLGVRLCGMKVFRPATGEEIHIDKMEGRRMNDDNFREAMFDFLFDGVRVRKDVIAPLVQKLQSLRSAVEQLPTHRFYSCSLLVVYDAAHRCKCHVGNNEGRCYGNEMTVGKHDAEICPADSNSDGSDGCDADMAKSENMSSSLCHNRRCSSASLKNDLGTRDLDPEQGQDTNNSAEVCACRVCGCQMRRVQATEVRRGNSGCRCVRVDARLVDFAHSTFAGFPGDKVLHPGSDHGCLKGLETLINTFTNILHRRDNP